MKLEDVDSLKKRIQELADELMSVIDELAEADVMGFDRPPRRSEISAARGAAGLVRQAGPISLNQLALLSGVNEKPLKKRLDLAIKGGYLTLDDGIYRFVKDSHDE